MRVPRFALALFTGLVSLSTLLLARPSFATPFVREVADNGGNVAYYTSLAIDTQGRPHISAYDFVNGDLRYLTRSRDGRWSVEIVDAADNVGNYTSIVLDAQGSPHIAYHDVTNGNLKYARRSGSTWLIETVDASANDVGLYASLALDPAGNPQIAYKDGTASDLLYAKKSGGVWTIETVTSAGNVGTYASLKVDERSHPHIAFQDVTNTDLRYATRAPGSSWILETVDAADGSYVSLALDPQGRPRISYRSGTATLAYAARNDGVWTTETADAAASVETSLALDVSGNPKISYRSSGQQDLRFASKSGSTWTLETVDFVADVGSYNSVALDPQGNPAITYRDNTTWELMYAESGVELLSPLGGELWPAGSLQTIRWRGIGTVSIQISDDGGRSYTTLVPTTTSNDLTITVPALTTDQARIRINRGSPSSISDSPGYFLIAPDLVSPWWVETVDFSVGVGDYTALALDPNGRPNLAYYSSGSTDLEYASRIGDGWDIQTADGAAINSGNYNSLAIDELGNPHISTFDNSTHDLRYVTRSGGTWSAEVVDTTGSTGVFSSIALATPENPRISYWDPTNGDLRFAEKNGGVWTLNLIDDGGGADVGPYTSMALDSRNEPHIVYYSNTDGDLKYVRRSGGVWQPPEIVDGATANVGGYASLELDHNDDPHVAYYRFDGGDLRYAVKRGAAWTIETVDAPGSVGAYCSLALNALDEPGISYQDDANDVLKFASRHAGVWRIETLDATGQAGFWTSLTLDPYGNAHIGYFNLALSHPYYASSAVLLGEPNVGSTWPVGSTREITWKGSGRVDVSLSVDGGASWQTLATGVTGNEYRLVVPHTPTRFAQVKVERAVPRSVSITPGLFTIETDIALLSLKAEPGDGGGVLLSWATDPGPKDLSGYRIEKRWSESDWHTLVAFTRETSFLDPDLLSGSQYRLFGINGLGQELLLGETTFGILTPLAAGPLPYRGGDMTITFASDGGFSPTDVSLYDLQGRKVRTLAHGRYPVGIQRVTWAGRDDTESLVASGAYFLRLSDGSRSVAISKIIVTR